jgi:hypothetical protein
MAMGLVMMALIQCTCLRVHAGWQIAVGNADDIRVCRAHPWQSDGLVFANGDLYGTAMQPPFHRGKRAQAVFKIQILPHPKIGKTTAKWDSFDVLRRRRA